MTGHDYRFLASHGEDAPGKSLDTYSHCSRCGTVRHEYRHGGGLTSPNYPMFAGIGEPGWRAAEPPCGHTAPAMKESLELVLRDVGDGGPGSDYVSMYTVGRVRAALGLPEAD